MALYADTFALLNRDLEGNKLTHINVRIMLPRVMDMLESTAILISLDAFQAPNGAIITNFYESGVLLTDAKWATVDAMLSAAVGPATPLMAVRPQPARPARPAINPAPARSVLAFHEMNMNLFMNFQAVMRSFRNALLAIVDEHIREELKVNGSMLTVSLTDIVPSVFHYLIH